MPSLAYLDVNIWVSGWLSQPNLIIIYQPAPTADKTINYALTDSNGVTVTDTGTATLTAGSTRISINLGDFINAQRQLYSFGVGLYFVYVRIVEDDAVFALPIFISDVSVGDPPTGRTDLDHFLIIDKVTGFMIKLPRTVTAIPVDDRYFVFAYYHKEGLGRIVHFDATGTKFDTGYHKYVKMRVVLSFNSIDDLIYHMLQRSWGIPDAVAERVLAELNAGNYSEVFRLLRPFYSFVWIGKTLKLEFDDVNYNIIATVYTYLGQIDWGKVFGWGLLGCGLAMAGAIAFTVATAGVGATISLPLVAGACIAGGAIGAGVAIVTSSDSGGNPVVVEEARQTADEGKQLNKTYHDQAVEVLDNWLNQGKITQDDYNEMKLIIDKWYADMNLTIDELVKDVETAYNAGKEEGRDEAKWWIVGAGVGGLVIGSLLPRTSIIEKVRELRR